MLPFAQKKKRTSDDVMELGDDDFVIVESVPPASSHSRDAVASPRDADLAATVLRTPRRATIAPRRMVDEHVEEDVAGQCLASIAAETSRDYSSSHIRAALVRTIEEAPIDEVPIHVSHEAPIEESVPPTSVSRLPSVSPPPFVRTLLTAHVPFSASARERTERTSPEAPGVREISRPAAFVRRSSPVLPVAAPSSFAALTASTGTDGGSASSPHNLGSVAPVSMSQVAPNEPTVILVRERPRPAWILAAAAMGALGAILAMRLAAAPNGEPAPASAAAPQAPIALPATAVVAPSPVAAPSAHAPHPTHASAPAPASTSASQGPAVVRFSEEQGVAIKALAPPAPLPRKPAASSAPAARSAMPPGRAPSMGPALPDGSFGLGRVEAQASPPPSLTAPLTAPEPPRKRVLTPEQQLADAQLKASMK